MKYILWTWLCVSSALLAPGTYKGGAQYLSAQTQYEGVLKQSGLEILSAYTLTANYVLFWGVI